MVDTPIYVGTKNEGIPGSSVTKNPPALQELQETQVMLFYSCINNRCPWNTDKKEILPEEPGMRGKRKDISRKVNSGILLPSSKI